MVLTKEVNVDDKMKEAFERDYAKHDLGKDSYGDYKHQPTEDAYLDYCSGYQAATEAAEARFKPVVERLVADWVDVGLLNDAITLITKSLASMLTDRTFASPFVEDHRPRVPTWVMTHFKHDDNRRLEYINDIKQRLDWIRNATEKARKGEALADAARVMRGE